MKSENYATVDEVVALRNRAYELKLEAPRGFWELPAAALAKIYNGCGPDSWTDSMRQFATMVYANYKPEIAIHDYEYEMSDGTRANWHAANNRFRTNTLRTIDTLWPRWKFWRVLRRNAELAKRELAVTALENGSWDAWVDACKRRVRVV